MVDIEQVIYDYLDSTGTDFKDLVGDNIFVDRVEDFNGATEKGIMFRVKGGTSDEYIPIYNRVVDFFCFGGTSTPEDSKAIYRALYDVLHSLQNYTVDSGYIMAAVETVVGQTIIDPDAEFIQVFTTYQFQIRAIT